jgi:Flp pilus assembly pilin Flp
LGKVRARRPLAGPVPPDLKENGMEAMAGIKRFWQSESAAVAVEYGLLIAFITLAIIGAVTAFGSNIKEKLYGDIIAKFPS